MNQSCLQYFEFKDIDKKNSHTSLKFVLCHEMKLINTRQELVYVHSMNNYISRKLNIKGK